MVKSKSDKLSLTLFRLYAAGSVSGGLCGGLCRGLVEDFEEEEGWKCLLLDANGETIASFAVQGNPIRNTLYKQQISKMGQL